MQGTTPQPALEKITTTTRRIEEAAALLRDAQVIIAERTSGSTLSGVPELNAALHNLLGDDPEADPVLSHVRAIPAMNGVASQTW